MDLINDTNSYLSGSEKIKYIAVAVCGILTLQVLFKTVKDKMGQKKLSQENSEFNLKAIKMITQ